MENAQNPKIFQEIGGETSTSINMIPTEQQEPQITDPQQWSGGAVTGLATADPLLTLRSSGITSLPQQFQLPA
jgi:hypothetical protein